MLAMDESSQLEIGWKSTFPLVYECLMFVIVLFAMWRPYFHKGRKCLFQKSINTKTLLL